MTLEIRFATGKDVDAIADLAARLARSDDEADQGSTRGFLVSAFGKDAYQDFIDTANHFYVAYLDGRLAGFLLGYTEDRIGDNEYVNRSLERMLHSFVVIKQIGVDPGLGRKGIAGRLYAYVKNAIEDDFRTSIVAAVVDSPPNEVSARFHRKQGFVRYTEITPPEDGLPRVIWRYVSHPDDPALLNQQYGHAIELYRHEDSLNWEKLRNYVYLTVVLGAGLGILLQSKLDDPSRIGAPRFVMAFALCAMGILTSLGYAVALRSGVRYLSVYKDRVARLEKSYLRKGGFRIVSDPERPFQDERWAGTSPTVWMLRGAPIIGLVFWVAIIVLVSVLAAVF